MSSINDQLIEAYRAAGLSNYRVAKLSGVGASTIGRWLRGEADISVGNAERIAEAIGAKVSVRLRGGKK